MKQKMAKVPFDIELAKKITNGEVNGRIVTRNGKNVRIVCFDRKSESNRYPILALIESNKGETSYEFNSKGYTNFNGLETNFDLFLEIPEYKTFKEGDLIAYENGDLVLFKAHIFNRKCYQQYAVLSNSGLEIGTSACMVYDGTQLANEEKRQVFINALKSSEHPMAKEYLKRFFGIEQKQEYEFKFRDVVLVRSSDRDKWCAAEFSNKDGKWYAVFGGLYYERCIPYNDQTAHLLGTTENWEE